MAPIGVIYWNELNTWDVKKAMDYYGPIMGWTFDEVPSSDSDSPTPYYIAKRDGKPVAGFFSLYEPVFEGVPEQWFAYLSVKDLKTTIELNNKKGGKEIRGPFKVPEFGTFSIVQDAGGAVMGFIEPATMK